MEIIGRKALGFSMVWKILACEVSPCILWRQMILKQMAWQHTNFTDELRTAYTRTAQWRKHDV